MNALEQDIYQSKDFSMGNENLVRMVPMGRRSEISLENQHRPDHVGLGQHSDLTSYEITVTV